MGLPPETPEGKRKVGRLAIRTTYFDRAILEALGCTGSSTIHQVVLLGSGMASRAWRLDMPPGVRYMLRILFRHWPSALGA